MQFFQRADCLAKKFLHYGVVHNLKESKKMCEDTCSYDLVESSGLNPKTLWSSLATTYNYMSPAHTDEDSFMSFLFVSHVSRKKEHLEEVQYCIN